MPEPRSSQHSARVTPNTSESESGQPRRRDPLQGSRSPPHKRTRPSETNEQKHRRLRGELEAFEQQMNATAQPSAAA